MSVVIRELSEKLGRCFKDRSYGEDGMNLLIGVILTDPGNSRLHPTRGLKCRKLVKVKFPPVEFRNIIEYDLKPDFNLFSQLDLQQARAYLSDLLSHSITVLQDHATKFPDFDLVRFQDDFRTCLTD